MSFIPKIEEASTQNPKTLLVVSVPKGGKSTIAADFTVNFAPGESTIVSLDEQAPYDQLKCSSVQFEKFSEAEAWLDKVIESGEKINYLFVDHFTKIDELSELVGTVEYMQTNQGKSFNRDRKGNMLSPKSKDWKSVHELPNGAGYRHSRAVVMRFKSKCEQASNHTIFFAHLKDKEIVNVEGQTLRIEKKIYVTGKLGTIIPAYVNGVCYMYPDGNKRYLDFEASEKAALGATLPHLSGQILISEMVDGKLKTYWEKIFLDKKSK